MLKFSIQDEISRRILVLDGGLGTMVQGYDLSEEDYRGDRFDDSYDYDMGERRRRDSGGRYM